MKRVSSLVAVPAEVTAVEDLGGDFSVLSVVQNNNNQQKGERRHIYTVIHMRMRTRTETHQ